MGRTKKDRLPPSHEIARYWAFSDTALARSELACLDIDYHAPECFACKECYWSVSKGRGRFWDRQNPDKAWDDSHLQRCHIVPEALGGETVPSNLFLLCKRCHDLAPDTVYPDVFFAWCRKQGYTSRRLKEISEAFDVFDIPKTEWVSTEFASSEFMDWAKDKISDHFSEGFKASSWAGLFHVYMSTVKSGRQLELSP